MRFIGCKGRALVEVETLKVEPPAPPSSGPYSGPRQPAAIRYVKLGEGGSWFDPGIQNGEIRFTDIVPHGVAAAGDWDEARRLYIEAGARQPGQSIRELRDFYERGADCLWITIGRGRLWWGFADPLVVAHDGGERTRQVIGGWSCIDAGGRELALAELSTRLTKVAAYRRTICGVQAEDYLMRRLLAEPDAISVRVCSLRTAMVSEVEHMLADLDWRDFEVLVDLVFAGSGWRRVTAVGGSGQADTDLVLEQALTGERAFVQVKSEATAAVFKDYLERYRGYPGVQRFIFACHTPRGGGFPTVSDPDVQLWLRPELAEQTLRAGLVDWLVEKRR
jgi:hypothetical protein